MILMESFDPQRKPFTKADADGITEYVAKHPENDGTVDKQLISVLLQCKYEQGVRDCADGIITAAQIDEQHKREYAKISVGRE